MDFSIIIPVYNAKGYLGPCVEGILAQREEAYELILVDDGSTDGSSALCDEYAAKDPRVRVLHKENGGQVSARKMGIHAAQGDYICYVDADDTVRPNWLKVIGACLRAGDEPDILAFGLEKHWADGVSDIVSDLPEGLYDYARLQKEVFPHAICDRRKAYTTQLIYPVAWNKVYRRSLLEAHHCQDARIRRGEDTAFVYECLLNARSLYVTHQVLYDYNYSVPTSISAAYGFRLTENDVYLADYLRARLSGFPVENQINDFVLSKVIRSVLWKAKHLPPAEAKATLRREIEQTGILQHIHLRGLPLGPAVFLTAIKCRLYGPLLAFARGKSSRADSPQTKEDASCA